MCLQIAFFFFGTYMMAAVLLLLNMLIAILMDVYGQVWLSLLLHGWVAGEAAH